MVKVHNENHAKKWPIFFSPTILPRLRSPVISKTFHTNAATSVVACVHGSSIVAPLVPDACYDRGARLFFLILPLNSGAKDLSQKTDLVKNKTSTG